MINPETMAREKILFAYTLALEEGNFERLESILEQAAKDPILERQILGLNAALSEPQGEKPAFASEPEEETTIWERLKTFLANLLSPRLWTRSLVRSLAVVMSVVIVFVVVILSLLGPAIGNVFSNVVSHAPHDLNLPNEQLQGLSGRAPYPVPQPTMYAPYSALRETQAFAATQTPYSPADAFNAYPGPGSPVQPAERLIVRSGSLIVEAKDTRQARQAVMAMINEYAPEGAFVVSSNETYPYSDQMPQILMTLRVPVKHYDESMARIYGLGIRVLGRQENAQDVTQEFVDVSARVEALKTSRARLLEIVKEAKNTEDLLRAEQELSRRETELEAAAASQKYLSQTAALSSITLELQPPPISQPVTDNSWNPELTFRNALRTLLASLRGFADDLIYFSIATLPWLAAIALVIFAVVRIYRWWSKK